jgi:prepilin peptidase CpaA
VNQALHTTAVGQPAGVAAGRDIAASLRTEFSAAVVAALVVACLVFSSSKMPLPALPWAAAFLFFAIQQDVRGMRIPNWLTLPSLAAAIGLGGVTGGLAGLGTALAGAGAALAILLLPFACRAMGAGDVKAAMVLGALWGVDAFVPTFWWMVLSGGVIAIALVAAQGGLLDLLRRWAKSAKYSLILRRIIYFQPGEQSAAAGGLPCAVAMGLGAVAQQIWGTPWA